MKVEEKRAKKSISNERVIFLLFFGGGEVPGESARISIFFNQ